MNQLNQTIKKYIGTAEQHTFNLMRGVEEAKTASRLTHHCDNVIRMKAHQANQFRNSKHDSGRSTVIQECINEIRQILATTLPDHEKLKILMKNSEIKKDFYALVI